MTQTFSPTLFPFESRFLPIDGHVVHYIDEGHGPTLLFFHGNPTSSFLYRDIVLRLRCRFRCVAFDYPGFGLSAARKGYDYKPSSHARVATELIDRLGIARFSLMVQDWGGPIGLAVAVQRPEAVRGVVIGNSWAWPVDGDPHFERFSKLMGGPLGGFAIRRCNAFVNVILPSGVQRKLAPEVVAAYRQPFPTFESREPLHVFPREILGSSDFLRGVESGLAQLRSRPVLLLWGARDPVFRSQERERFEKLFPLHKTIMLENASHYIQEDAPEQIVLAIDEWWGQHVVESHAEH
jgi:haloalkane dehalogenase